MVRIREILSNKGLTREGRLILSTLKVSKNMDVSNTKTGKYLQNKGFVNKTTGKITSKGKKTLGVF